MIEGYEGFEKVEDAEIRSYNQGIMMANIYEDHPHELGLTAEGMGVLCAYFQVVPDENKQDVMDVFKASLVKRGLADVMEVVH